MKIKEIILQNFESHVDTRISFDPTFNCIIGPTNAGKTAVFNAILFALFNEWDSGYLRRDAEFCRVVLVCDTFVLERIKGPAVNKVIITVDKDTYVFENFGKDYPPEVKRLIGLDSLDDYTPYFALQDNSSFLIYDSSTARASYLNKIGHVDLLEDTIKNVQSEIKTTESEIRSLSVEKTNVARELKRLRLIDKIEQLHNKLERLETKKFRIQSEISELSLIKQRISDLETQVQKYTSVFNEIPELDVLEKWDFICQSFLDLIFFYNHIRTIEKTLQQHMASLEQVTVALEKTASELSSVLLTTKCCPLCGASLTDESINRIFEV